MQYDVLSYVYIVAWLNQDNWHIIVLYTYDENILKLCTNFHVYYK